MTDTETLFEGGCLCEGGSITGIRDYTKNSKKFGAYHKKTFEGLKSAELSDKQNTLKEVRQQYVIGKGVNKSVKGIRSDKNTQYVALTRISKLINTMAGKTVVASSIIKDDKEFKARANKISKLIIKTGGNQNTDFLAIKHSIATRTQNLKEIIVVLKTIVNTFSSPGVTNKPEYKELKTLVLELSTLADSELDILEKALGITTRHERMIAKIIKRQENVKELLESHKIKPGTIETGKMLVQLLNTTISTAEHAKMVSTFLKEIGLTLADYEKLPMAELQSKALSLSKKDDNLKHKARVIKIVKYLASLDSKKKDVLSKMKKGGDPPSYTDKVKEKNENRKEVYSVYMSEFQSTIERVWTSVSKLSHLLGTELTIDQALEDFSIAYAQLEQLEGTPYQKSVLGYTTDSLSVAIKDRFIKNMHVVIAKAKELDVRGQAKECVSQIIKSFESLLKVVESYDTAISGGFVEKNMNFSTFKASLDSLKWFIKVGKMKENMHRAADDLTQNLKEFEPVLRRSLKLKEAEIKKDYDEKIKMIKDLPIDKDETHVRKEVTDYVNWAYGMKAKMWSVAQALEIYLKEFNIAVLNNYEDFIKLKNVLDPVKIIIDTDGSDIVKLFEPSWGDEAKYGDYLMKSKMHVYDKPIFEIDSKFSWKKREAAITKARECYHTLKNVMSLFTGIGDKIGKEGVIMLRKRTSLSITQMWEILGDFLMGSMYKMYHVPQKIKGDYKYISDMVIDLTDYHIISSGGKLITLSADDKKFVADTSSFFKEGDIVYFTKPSRGLAFDDSVKYNKFYRWLSPSSKKYFDGSTISIMPSSDSITLDSGVLDAGYESYSKISPLDDLICKSVIPINVLSRSFDNINSKTFMTVFDDLRYFVRFATTGLGLILPNLKVYDSSTLTSGMPQYTETLKHLKNTGNHSDKGIGTKGTQIKDLQNLDNLMKTTSFQLLFETFNAYIDMVDLVRKLYSTLNPTLTNDLASYCSKLNSTMVNHTKLISLKTSYLDLVKENMISEWVNPPTTYAPFGYQKSAFKLITENMRPMYNENEKLIRCFIEEYIKEWDSWFSTVSIKNTSPDQILLYYSQGATLKEVYKRNTVKMSLFRYDTSVTLNGSVFDNYYLWTKMATDIKTRAIVPNNDNITYVPVYGSRNFKSLKQSDGSVWVVIGDYKKYSAIPLFQITDFGAVLGRVRTNYYGSGEIRRTRGNYVLPITELSRGPGDVIDHTIPNHLKTDKCVILMSKIAPIVEADSLDKMSLVLNKAKRDTTLDPTSKAKYQLWRNNTELSVIQHDAKSMCDFDAEHGIFKTCIKAMYAKMVASVGVFEIFNNPSKINIFGPERLILGGAIESIETIEEAIPLYIRLPLFIEAYKVIFLNQSNIDREEFETKGDESITFLPEMRGTVFDGLFTILWRKVNDDEFFSENDCQKIVHECNRVYQKFKGKNVLLDTINALIKEVNSRYGKMKVKEINAFNQYVKDEEDFDTRDGSKRILPGEGIPEYPGSLEVHSMSFGTSLNNNMYDYSKTKPVVYNFMSRMNAFFNQTKEVSDKSLDQYIKTTQTLYQTARSPVEKLQVVLKGIRGVNSGQNGNSMSSLFIHEMIKTPLGLLMSLYERIYKAIEAGSNMKVKERYEKIRELAHNDKRDELFNYLEEDKVINMGVGYYHTTITDKIFAFPIAAIHGINPLEFRDLSDKIYDNTIPYISETESVEDAFVIGKKWDTVLRNPVAGGAAPKYSNSEALKTKVMLHIVDWSKTFAKLLDVALALQDGNLVTLRKEAGYITIDWSGLRTYVDNLLEITKRLIDFVRPNAPEVVKELEGIQSGTEFKVGTFFWLKQHLLDNLIMGKTKKGVSLERFRTNLKDAYHVIVNEKINIYNTLASRIAISTQSLPDTKAGPINPLINRIKVIESTSKKSLHVDDQQVLNAPQSWYGWTDEVNLSHKSLLVNTNDLLEHYLNDIYDYSCDKVYSKLLYSITSGVVNKEVLNHKETVFNVLQGQMNQPNSKSVNTGTNYHLTSTVSFLLRRIFNSYDKTKKEYLIDTFTDIPTPHKERLKNVLPMYKQAFELINQKGIFLRELTSLKHGKAFPLMHDISYMPLYEWHNKVVGGGFKMIKMIDTVKAGEQYKKVLPTYHKPGINFLPSMGANFASTESKDIFKFRDAAGTIIAASVSTNFIVSALGTSLPTTFDEYFDVVITYDEKLIDTSTKWYIIFQEKAIVGGVSVFVAKAIYTTKRFESDMEIYTRNILNYLATFGYSPSDNVNIDGATGLPTVKPNTIHPDSSKYLSSYIDDITTICRGMINDINTVLLELDDVPIHGQLSTSFIDNYKDTNGKLPLMPLSIVSWFLTNNVRFSGPGSDISKLEFATRALRGLDMKKLDIGYFDGLSEIIKDYTTVFKTEVDKKYISDLLVNFGPLMKYAYYQGFRFNFNNTNYPTVTLTSPRPKEMDMSIKEVINIMESQKQDDVKTNLTEGTITAITKRDQSILVNIMDININPVNIYDLYRQIPFLGIYLYSFNADRSIVSAFNDDFFEREAYHNMSIEKYPISSNVARLTKPYEQKLFKLLVDDKEQIFDKPEFSSLMINLGEGINKNIISNASNLFSKSNSYFAKSIGNHYLLCGDDTIIPGFDTRTFVTIDEKRVNTVAFQNHEGTPLPNGAYADTREAFWKEASNRFRVQGVQDMLFIEYLLGITKNYLTQKALSFNNEQNPDGVLQSTSILQDYIKNM